MFSGDTQDDLRAPTPADEKDPVLNYPVNLRSRHILNVNIPFRVSYTGHENKSILLCVHEPFLKLIDQWADDLVPHLLQGIQEQHTYLFKIVT